MSHRTGAARVGVVCLSLALLGVAGCSATLRRPSAKEYRQQAAASFEKEKYLDAADQYQELLDQYPLNPYAEEALLKNAYSHFMEENYIEAVALLKDFERAYPTSPHMPFVKYFLGIANYTQIRSLDRDQAVTRRADGFFQDVIDRYPESAFVLHAEDKSRASRDILAQHELYVAEFNRKRGNDAATKARLRGLIEQYSETDATIDALDSLARILDEEGNLELADLASRALEARRNAAGGAAESDVDASDADGVLVAGVDPLLLLVSELKKQEDAERLARTESDAERLSAEKEAERQEREADDAQDDAPRSFEVGDDYREVDLVALERERERARTAALAPDVDSLELESTLELEEGEPAVGPLSDEELDGSDTLTLDLDEEVELEDAAAAGVLDPEDVAGESAERIGERELAEAAELDSPAVDEAGPSLSPPDDAIPEATESHEVARVADTADDALPVVADASDGPDSEDTVLGIAIEDIDFEFEDD